MDKSRANALVVIDKHRKRKNLLRRSYLKKVKCARQNYKPEDVLAAMHAIWRGMSRRQAAKVFNIPRSTLLDKLDGKRPVDASPGPNPFLSKAEEQTLESWAIDLHQRGFPLKTEDLKDMAQAVIQNNQRRTSFKNGRPGRSWMRNFLLRHPKVYEISTDMTPGPRRSRTVTSRGEVRQWCQHHRQFMASIGQENILDHPDRIFSIDHGEFMFDSTTGLLIEQERNDRSEEKDRDKPEQTDCLSAGTDCVSLIATFTAGGGMAPWMFVYPSKDLQEDLINTFPPGWIAAHSECGLVTGSIFLDYIISFKKWLDQVNATLPVLLLVDGRRSRLNMDVTRYCEEQGIILFCLFPTPRPAISELCSPILHSSNNISKFKFASHLHEALNTFDASENLRRTNSVLLHLRSMLQTLAEVRAEPLVTPTSPSYHISNVFSLANNYEQSAVQAQCGHDDSDCEVDSDLTPIEGEIEIEFPFSENCDPYELAHDPLALHPSLLADSDVPRYLVFKYPVPIATASPVRPTSSVHVQQSEIPASSNISSEDIEDRVDQPDVKAHLIIKPLSSPLPETENGITQVESEIDDIVGTILSMGVSHVESDQLSVAVNVEEPAEEPFLGFSPEDTCIQQSALDAHGCMRFIHKIISEKGLLEDFKIAKSLRHWNGAQEAKFLFDTWLAATDECGA